MTLSCQTLQGHCTKLNQTKGQKRRQSVVASGKEREMGEKREYGKAGMKVHEKNSLKM